MVESGKVESESESEVEEQFLGAPYSQYAREKFISTVCQKYYSFLHAYLDREWSSNSLHDPAIDVDDIIQETWMKAYVSLDQFRGNIYHFRAWLRVIARNVMLDKIRIAQRRACHVKKHSSVDERTHGPQRLVNLIDPRAEEPSETLARYEEWSGQQEALWNSLLSLSARDRSIIEEWLCGCPSGETADLLGMSPGTVRAIRCRALRRLRAMLEHE
jgi:RNA polymerase sigma factor (sigma-70 family)